MEIDFAILADGAQVVNNKLYVLGGGWDIIWPQSIPTAHRATLAVGIMVGWNETNQRHSLGISVRSMDDQLLQEVGKGEFEAGRPAGVPAGSSQKVMVAITFDINIPGPGEYVIATDINNGSVSRRLPFRVASTAPSQTTP